VRGSGTTIAILLADDHTIVRDGLGFLLEAQEGIQVVGVASDGREAVKEAERLRPDVVVMDLAMPGLNGIEATRRIRKLLPATRVLVLSMHGSSEHIYRALEAGAQGYLLKESAGPELAAALRAVHGGRRYLSSKITETVVDQYVRERKTNGPLASLSAREREILQLVVEGKASAPIAEQLGISVKSVETYRSRIMHKLGIHDLPSLVKFAIQHGIISLD
jgi:DNA-binding NarL/FixJ family response regulator